MLRALLHRRKQWPERLERADRAQVEATATQLLKIEQVIELLGQRIAAAPHHGDRLTLLGRKLAEHATVEQLQVAHQRGERRAQLVREAGEKLAFEPVELLHLGVGLGQLAHALLQPLHQLLVVGLQQLSLIDVARQLLALAADKLGHLLRQQARVDRLEQVAVAARHQGALAGAGGAVGGERHDRHAPQMHEAAQARGRLVAIQAGDAQIHKHQGGPRLAGQGQALGAVLGDDHLVAARAEHALHQALVVAVVFDVEDFLLHFCHRRVQGTGYWAQGMKHSAKGAFTICQGRPQGAPLHGAVAISRICPRVDNPPVCI